MVLAPRPRHATFTPAQVTGFYFRPCHDANNEIVSEYFRCRCSTVQKQTRRNGYSSLMQHVRREHPDYEVVMLTASTAETGSVLNYVRRSALNVFGWLDWIIKTASRSTSARILLQEDIQIWTRFVSKHFSGPGKPHSDCGALHRCRNAGASWAHPRRMEPRLGAFRRRLCLLRSQRRHGDPATLHGTPAESARGHYEFLAGMLPRDYGKQLSDCSIAVGDNCAVNRLLATFMGVPLVGYTSHRLNRAVQVDMEQYEDDLACVQALMMRLRTLKQSAKFRLKTSLLPVIRQETRWSSTFSMVQRNFKLLEHLDPTDDAIVDVLPAPPCNKRLLSLLKDLKKGLIAVKPHYARLLRPRADIVHSPDFESGCVRVLGGSHRLTRAEKVALQPFCCVEEEPSRTTEDASSTDSEDEGFFVENLQKRRRLAAVEPRVTRTTYGQERHSLQPITLELVLFLRQNGEYWTSQTVDEATR
ncbi:hypothetical protein PC119_g14565 [Phytophthora cactorum]|nr:hypothetical protein PC119_g14565 [Phytophthora cactorum]